MRPPHFLAPSCGVLLALLFAMLLAVPLCGAQVESETPPSKLVVRAYDTPSDDGSSNTIKWELVQGAANYRIEHTAPGEQPVEVGRVSGQTTKYEDGELTAGVPYTYRVSALDAAGNTIAMGTAGPAMPRPQWFNGNLLGVLIGFLAFAGIVVWFIVRARRGEKLFLRRIAGLDAVDEAVGRATEMGRAVLFIPGIGYISDISTVAGLNILGEVAKKTAQYGTRLNVPLRDPVVFTVAREVVKNAYSEVGRPDAFDPNSVHFVVEYGLAYASAVAGIMVRERPATNLLLGYFAAESLILAETGASTGAIQIAGTDQVTQLPFFVVACDYTLIGEELYAASAYLSREPLMVGAVKGQDVGKVVFLVLLIAGSLFSLITGLDAGWIFSTTGY